MNTSIVVRFKEGRWLPQIRDGLDYLLRYSYVDSKFIDMPEEESKTKDARIVVGISGTLAAVWNLTNDNLLKVLHEYGKRHIDTMISEGALAEKTEIQLTTFNAPEKCPFDPSRIELDFDKPFELKLPIENPVSASEPSSLAFSIVDLRDSINAIFGEKFKGRLVTLPQERHLVELFKDCTAHEEFAYRVASLGGLATAFDLKLLKGLLKQEIDKEDPGSLDIFGEFLRQTYSNDAINDLLDILQNFNHLRRMYPIHTDRADGVLKAYSFFTLEYPVTDYTNSWQTLLEKYQDALRILLDIIKCKSS